MFEHGLKTGDVIDNNRLREIFKCSPQGGMRKSNVTNTLVLISNHIKSIYEDRWIGNTLHYTGMGMAGDQKLDFAQNKTLNNSETNGVQVFLFEVFKEKTYTFIGPVILSSIPYQELQPDESNTQRKVWIFPIQVAGNATDHILDKDVIRHKEKSQQKKAKKLSNQELLKRSKHSQINGHREVKSKAYFRSPYISELVKRLANGICDLCEQDAPFGNQAGEPFLETHHIIWLAQGGEDSLKNTVALCPNCHRKMHILSKPQDVTKLQSVAASRAA